MKTRYGEAVKEEYYRFHHPVTKEYYYFKFQGKDVFQHCGAGGWLIIARLGNVCRPVLYNFPPVRGGAASWYVTQKGKKLKRISYNDLVLAIL